MPGVATARQPSRLAPSIGAPDGVEIHRLGRRRRRGLAEVDEYVAIRRREMGDEESAAAEVAAAGIGHRLGEADRDRRVDRVAALAQNVGADLEPR